MKLLKRAAAIVLALAILLSFGGCGGKDETPGADTGAVTDSPVASDDTGDDYTVVKNNFYDDVRRHLNSIGSEDYEGAVFLIATPASELFNEDECGAVMSRAVDERNARVESKLHVTISAKKYDIDTLYSVAYNANLANDYFADIIMVPQYYIGQFASSGMLFNLNSLPFSDYSAGYNIDSGASAAMGASDGYALAGWASLQPDGLPCVFFNKAAAEASGLESPYELVKRGEWTWDKFFEYTAAVPDINGKLDAPVASWATQNSSLNMADIVYASEGNKFINAGLGNSATVAITYDGSLHSVTNGQRLYGEPNKHADSMSAFDTFSNGGSLFFIDSMGMMKDLAASNTVWGVLPIPKGSAEQETYCSLAPADSLFFAVPANTKNAEEVSLVMASLNAASLGYMVDAYVTDAMCYYLRDNASVEMVEKVCYGVTYDMAYSFGATDTAISNGTYFALRNVYEMNHDLNFYISRFAGAADRALAGFFPQ